LKFPSPVRLVYNAPMPTSARLLAALACLLAAAPAGALTLLTAGKVGVFSSRPGRAPEAVVRIGRDRALAALPSPACPTVSSFRLALSRTGADFEDHGEIPLPCDRWQRRGRSWRFSGAHGAAGGVRSIVLDARRLVIRAGGPAFEAVAGPLAYVEAWLMIGGERHLVRLQNFRRNDAVRVVSRRPSALAAVGEAAFWDTLWADAPRADEALDLLQRAVAHQRRDGRSQFLLGMLHLYRSTLACPMFDFANMCDAGRDEGIAAAAALGHAVDYLPHDSRIPGFRAASTYANGYVLGDPALLALGTQQIDAAVAANPLFNAFDLFAVVAPVTDGASASYQNEILPLADFVFSNASCLDALPEICGNAGMAPHNFEGTLLLLGDIYAKGGRLASAQFWYNLAVATGQTSGYGFQALAVDRAATAAARVALYQDADPTNDPPLLGGGGGSCIYCHNK
jgi:hypothetical protein